MRVCYFGLLLLLLSCNNKKKSPVENKIFRLNIYSNIGSLDPAFSKDQATMWACNQIYNSLLQLDKNLQIKPSIAKKWTISNNGLDYIFTLNKGIYFHENNLFKNKDKTRTVTAYDVVYSFNRIIDTNIASTGAWLFNGKVDSILPFEAQNDSTFVLHLKAPFRPILGLLALPYCSIVPHEVVDFYGKEFRSHPCGTGPFKLKIWKENLALVLTKNKNYFEIDSMGNRLPYLNGVKFTFLADRSIEYLEFKKGKLDFLNAVEAATKDKLLTQDGQLLESLSSEIVLDKMDFLNTEYLGIACKNQKNTALQNKYVRQAINYAIDRKKMIYFLRNNIGTPATCGVIPIGCPGFDNSITGYNFDINKAKELLQKAGYPNGKDISPITLTTNPQYRDLVEFIANNIAEIGIKVKIDILAGGMIREAMRKNSLDFFRASWMGDYPDGENYLALFYSKNGAPPNYTFYENKEYDKLYEEAIACVDNDKAFDLYKKLELMILEDAPIVPLFYDKVLRFRKKYVHGLENNGMNILNLKTVYFK